MSLGKPQMQWNDAGLDAETQEGQQEDRRPRSRRHERCAGAHGGEIESRSVRQEPQEGADDGARARMHHQQVDKDIAAPLAVDLRRSAQGRPKTASSAPSRREKRRPSQRSPPLPSKAETATAMPRANAVLRPSNAAPRKKLKTEQLARRLPRAAIETMRSTGPMPT